MRFPLNTIHWYLALPILAIIAYRSLRNTKKNPSSLNILFGFSALTFMLSMLAYGVPPLFFADSSMTLTYSTIVGDALQLIALFWLWLAAARIYFPDKSSIFYLVLFIDLLVVLAGIVFSTQDNMAYPVTMMYAQGYWQIDFAVSTQYQIAVAIQYFSLMLVGGRFWLQAGQAPKTEQKIRLIALAALCSLISAIFVLRPIFNINTSSSSISYLLASVLLLVAVSVSASLLLAKRSVAK
jgi:hypothetical protein